MSPYLSKNYRYQKKSRIQSLREAGLFVGFSMLAIMLVLFILGWVAYAFQAQAAVGINQQLNYQGKLSDANGVAVSNGDWNFKFEIYDALTDGNLLWTERWTATTTQVSSVNGVFSVTLGSLGQADLSTIDWNSDSLFLQVDLDADVDAENIWEETFGTRKRITSAGYAFNADMLDGFHANYTSAASSTIPVFDKNLVLNLFSGGVSSTKATTSEFIFIGPNGDADVIFLDRQDGDLFVADDVEIVGNATTTGYLAVGLGCTKDVINYNPGDVCIEGEVDIGNNMTMQGVLRVKNNTAQFGVEDTTAGRSIFFGSNDTTGGSFHFHNGATYDDIVDFYRIGASTTDGANLQISAMDADDNGSVAFKITANTTTPNVLVVNNLGIGTETPYYPLEISTTTATTTLYVVGGSRFEGNATTTGNFSANSNFYARDSKIGIATTTPWRTLALTGTMAIDGLTALSGGNGDAICIVDGDEIQYNSGAVDCTVSSERYKNTIFEYSDGLETILALDPVTFKYNGEEDIEVGLIAEQVEEVDPRLVAYNHEGQAQSVKQFGLIANLIGATQSQQEQINNLLLNPTYASTSPLTVINDPENSINTLVVQQAATFYGTIYVQGEAGFEHKVVFEDDVEIQGKLYVDNDQAGTIVIPAGATSTEVIFNTEYQVAPKVVALANLDPGTRYWTANKSTLGFRLSVLEPVDHDITFDWIALAVKQEGKPPVINNLISSLESVSFDEAVSLIASASDPDTDSANLTYTWSTTSNLGFFAGTGNSVFWTIGEGEVDSKTEVTIKVTVSDGSNSVIESRVVTVVMPVEEPPEEPTPPEEPEEPLVVLGCTDETALNYDFTAAEDDGTCEYEPVVVIGCMDETALNYNPEVTEDDSSCEYPLVLGCTDSEALNYSPEAEEDDGTCTYEEIVQGDGEGEGVGGPE